MYIVSQQCKDVLARSSRTFTAFFITQNGIRYDNVKSLKMTNAISSDGQITIGSTSSKMLEMDVDMTALLVNQKITVYIGVLLDDETYENIPLGKFTVLSSTTKDNMLTVNCCGALSVEAEMGYFTNLNYPTTTIAVLNEISKKIGITINTAGLETITINTKPEGYTYREVIGFIAAMHGRFATEMRDGTISLKWYEAQSTDIFTDKSSPPEISQEYFSINMLKCTVSDNVTYSRGSGMMGITVSNPFMTDSAMTIAWNRIKNYVYKPSTINVLSGNPCIDVFDSYTYEHYNFICADLEYVFDGGIQVNIKSTGKSESDSSTEYKGPTALAMERYYAELVIINNALINTLSVDEADIRYLQVSQLSAIEAEIERAVIQQLDSEYLKANFADIRLANIEMADVGTFLAECGLITSATIVDGHITGYLDAVEVNANKITAGELSVERLIIRGSDDSIVYALNNFGQLVSTNVDTIDGYVLTPRTITADRIVAGAITANEIASNTITASKINVSDLFAQNITATGTITGLNLVSATVKAGIIQSTNYINGGSGILLNLNTGVWDSKYFKIAVDGSVSASNLSMIGGEINMLGSSSKETKIRLYFESTNIDYHTEISPYSVNVIAIAGMNSSGTSTLSGTGLTVSGTNIGTTEIFGGMLTTQDGNFEYKNASYSLSTESFICNSWVRTVGSTGWLSQTYGGGWYMTDTTWIRNYGSKAVYLNAMLRVDANIQFGSSGSYYVNSSGTAYLNAATLSGTLTLSKSTDAETSTDNSPALIVGGTRTTAHIEIDSNEILAKATGTTQAVLYINDGMMVDLGSIRPVTSGYQNIGSANYRWSTLYTTTINCSSEATIGGSLRVNAGIELFHATPYIDFHFSNSTADYTTRIIESSSGRLDISASLRVGTAGSGNLVIYGASLHMGSTGTSAGNIYGSSVTFRNASTGAPITIYAMGFTVTSALRYKKNITSLTEADAYKLMMLNPVQFDYINGDKNRYGLIAEDTESIYPGIVMKNEAGQIEGISYTDLIPFLIKMVQIQQKEINKLKQQLPS